MPDYKIQMRRGTAAEWTAANPVLAAGEIGVETDTQKMKVGNGTSNWSSLTYVNSAALVTSVQGQTGAVTISGADLDPVGPTSSLADDVSLLYTQIANTVLSTDARLSDARTPTSHSHGDLTNDGKLGTVSGRVAVTGSGGSVTTATIGSGLTLSGGTLSASGGGSSVGSDLYLWSIYR